MRLLSTQICINRNYFKCSPIYEIVIESCFAPSRLKWCFFLFLMQMNYIMPLKNGWIFNILDIRLYDLVTSTYLFSDIMPAKIQQIPIKTMVMMNIQYNPLVDTINLCKGSPMLHITISLTRQQFLHRSIQYYCQICYSEGSFRLWQKLVATVKFLTVAKRINNQNHTHHHLVFKSFSTFQAIKYLTYLPF